MSQISQALITRSDNTCELCASEKPSIGYSVSPKSDDLQHQVALCSTCETMMSDTESGNYWQCLAGSIWSAEPAVQALSYRILYGLKDASWAEEIISSVDLGEDITQWALSFYEVADVHKDAYGSLLENGDTVVLTQALKVKGTSFSAAKGTVVKRIHLVSDNTEQIEGKINDQTIVILTKFVKKNG